MATTPGTSAASTRACKTASISSLRDGVRSGAARLGMAAPGISPAAATAAVRNNVSRRLNRIVIALPSTLWNLSAAGGKHSLQFQYRAVGCRQHWPPGYLGDPFCRRRHAILRQRDQIAIAQISRRFDHQAVMGRAVAAIERGHGAFR